MEVRWYVLTVVVGSGIVTFLPRVLPLIFLSRMQLPNWSVRWLSHVPIAVFAALLGQELLISNGKFSSLLNNIELFAAVPTFLVGFFTRSLFGTVVAGIISMIVLHFIF